MIPPGGCWFFGISSNGSFKNNIITTAIYFGEADSIATDISGMCLMHSGALRVTAKGDQPRSMSLLENTSTRM